MSWATLVKRMTRRKTFGLEESDPLDGHGPTQLAKVLNTFDLTLLGIGSTLGVGVYVLAGLVARDTAGPAVCLSFLIAALASAFAAMCYAEFGARVPKAGSAYIYSYVTIGEMVAFFIGWNLILEYVIGVSSVALSFSANFDKLLNNSMSEAFEEYFPLSDGGTFAPYVDFFAFGAILFCSGLLCFGMRSSATINNIFTFVNMGVIVFVVIAGSLKADVKNWNISKENITIPGDWGEGGFLPYGFGGVIKGAAKCFFGFVGFDSIAATGEEAKNAKKSIPLSINLTLIVVFLAYFGISVVLTLMVPYYEQDPTTPLISAFDIVGWHWAGLTIGIGSLFGLSACLLGGMMPMPRILYAIAKDGLIFRFLAYVNPRFQTPVVATVLSGLAAALLSILFDLETLVDMMSIGTLMAYSLVALSVLVLRYEEMKDSVEEDKSAVEEVIENKKVRFPWNKDPTRQTSKKAIYATCIFCGLALCLSGVLAAMGYYSDSDNSGWFLFGIGIFVGPMLLVIFYLTLLPRSKIHLYFKVPGVPLVPCLSITINLYLMFSLSPDTWIRFAVWMVVGIITYFGYGIWNSSEEYVSKGLPVPGSGVPVTKANGFGSQSTSGRKSEITVSSDFKISAMTNDSHTEEDPTAAEICDEPISRENVDVHQEMSQEKSDAELPNLTESLESSHLKAQAVFEQLKVESEAETEEKMAVVMEQLLEADQKLKTVFTAQISSEESVSNVTNSAASSTTPPPTPMPIEAATPLPPPMPTYFIFDETQVKESELPGVSEDPPVIPTSDQFLRKVIGSKQASLNPDLMLELKSLMVRQSSQTSDHQEQQVSVLRTLSEKSFADNTDGTNA